MRNHIAAVTLGEAEVHQSPIRPIRGVRAILGPWRSAALFTVAPPRRLCGALSHCFHYCESVPIP